MSPKRAGSRSAAWGSAPIRTGRKLGEVRRTQLITTYGVGAMVAVENESFMVAGIDAWNVDAARELKDRRLALSLNVKRFVLPPAPDQDDAVDGVRAVRFPLMYSCPECKVLQPFKRFNSKPGKATCGDCDVELVPSRFVMSCADGHIEDFPYWKWVHRGTGYGVGHLCGGELRLRADGSTASLRAVLISCTCGVKEVSMEGAFRRDALRNLGVRCAGRRPWLIGSPDQTCDEPPRTLQRGSSSVWFPVVHSALSIPPWSDEIALFFDTHFDYEKLKDWPREKIEPILDYNADLIASSSFTVADLLAFMDSRKAEEDELIGRFGGAADARDVIYQDEYKSLVVERPERTVDRGQAFVCTAPRGDMSGLGGRTGVEQVMLVKRLREVRALQSFTRINEPTAADAESRRSQIAKAHVDWLPAYEVSGEGVFLRLDTDRLRRWEKLPGPMARAAVVRERHRAALQGRAEAAGREAKASPVSPRYLLLHTLAHILINEWSLDGGYPTAALRERLYIGEAGSGAEMGGILLYTATSDSAGSLGGVVAQGAPDVFEATLRSALQRAMWCSNDPLCMESEASGTDSLNLAACHACVLLPETSCENNNILLDRAMLLGMPDGEVEGYFSC
jgi:Domain of unknown function (DUF1998)